MIAFAVEGVAVLKKEAANLFIEHWSELAVERGLLTPNLDWLLYQNAEAAGSLLVVTTRSNGALVGYFIAFLRNHPHYAHVLCAFEDMYFLSKNVRGPRVGMRMIEFAESELRRRGVQIVTLHSKIAHDHGRLLRHIGYSPLDTVYLKRL